MMRCVEARLCSRTVCGMGESKRQKGMGFSVFRPDFVKVSLDVCPAHHHLQTWKPLGRKWMRIIPIFGGRPSLLTAVAFVSGMRFLRAHQSRWSANSSFWETIRSLLRTVVLVNEIM